MHIDIVEFGEADSGVAVVARLMSPGTDWVLLRDTGVAVEPGAGDALFAATNGVLAATVSPIPCGDASHDVVAEVAGHPRLPDAPTITAPCLRAVLVSRDALASIPLPPLTPSHTVPAAMTIVFDRLAAAGWRHVAAPRAVMSWPGSKDAGEALRTHQLWARYTLKGPRVVIDGACLTDASHNGSQKVVIEVAKSLKQARPAASVTLAVRSRYLEHFRTALASNSIEVIERRHGDTRYDVVYRPYQLIDPSEAPWITSVADRVLISQLDMIGFSNSTYHPSPALFHGVRNLQRHMLRVADGVTFISEFGRSATRAECPDLQPERTFVVACGAESSEVIGDATAAPIVPDDFILCLSSTFMHKNRPHALRVFAGLVARGYAGALVIAGPEPYYGRSTDVEQDVIDQLDPAVRQRIVRLGQVSEPTKWHLLRSARLVVYPSVVEGFGLIPFEAAAVDTPTVAFAGTGLGELLGSADCMVPTWRLDEWVDTAGRLLGNPDASRQAIEQIREIATQHTWLDTATKTWGAIDATAAAPRTRPVDEEGGRASSVAAPAADLMATARPAHFLNRSLAFLRRRFRHLQP